MISLFILFFSFFSFSIRTREAEISSSFLLESESIIYRKRKNNGIILMAYGFKELSEET